MVEGLGFIGVMCFYNLMCAGDSKFWRPLAGLLVTTIVVWYESVL